MKKLTIAIIAALALGGCQITKSPTGRTQALMYSSQDMSKLGSQSFAEILKKEKRNEDAKLNNYVNCVADAITAEINAKDQQAWEVVVFESDQVNAFALPGGHIGVYTGLLKVAETPSQLAAVIGHEVGHVLAHHSNERLSRSQFTQIGLELADTAFQVAGSEYRKEWMSALGLGAQVGITLPYGRKQESESDLIGLDLMAKAGFDPSQSVSLWQRMKDASGGKSQLELLSTHPSNERRIRDLNNNMGAAQGTYQRAVQAGKKPACRI